jgi:hypothetical protein
MTALCGRSRHANGPAGNADSSYTIERRNSVAVSPLRRTGSTPGQVMRELQGFFPVCHVSPTHYHSTKGLHSSIISDSALPHTEGKVVPVLN